MFHLALFCSGAFDLIAHTSEGFARAVAPGEDKFSSSHSEFGGSSVVHRRCDPLANLDVSLLSAGFRGTLLKDPTQGDRVFDALALSRHHCALLSMSSIDTDTSAAGTNAVLAMNSMLRFRPALSASFFSFPAAAPVTGVDGRGSSSNLTCLDADSALPLRLYRSLSLGSFACSATPRYQVLARRMNEQYIDHIAGELARTPHYFLFAFFSQSYSFPLFSSPSSPVLFRFPGNYLSLYI